MAEAWNDPFPTTDELMERQTKLGLVHLLLRFARDHGDLREGEAHEGAHAIAQQIFDGFGVLNQHARTRLKNAEAALRGIRMMMPPSPVAIADNKVAIFKAPEPDKMLYVIKLSLDRYDEAARSATAPSDRVTDRD